MIRMDMSDLVNKLNSLPNLVANAVADEAVLPELAKGLS